ncbi:hypothetical protein ATCC90586_011224 [Pythium insidiosum]|nr:hypothetical protein ATCC90586_011224 [Pythium insidiosum]
MHGDRHRQTQRDERVQNHDPSYHYDGDATRSFESLHHGGQPWSRRRDDVVDRQQREEYWRREQQDWNRQQHPVERR